MLSDKRSTVVVSSMGWVDHASLWVFRVADANETRLPLGDSKYVSLHSGSGDFFSVLHHFNGNRIEVTVHDFSEPRDSVTRAVVTPDGSRVLGDLSAWAHVQTNYVSYYAGPLSSDFALVRVKPNEGLVELQQFDWYNDDYDKGYQGVIGVAEVPGQDLLIVSVQRDSHPVLYDPVSRKKIGALDLCGRGGNPTLAFRQHASELWADDYDTIVKLEVGTWRILKSALLQDASTGTEQFVGKFSFDADETSCVVARPFSRDVVALSTQSLRPEHSCMLEGQPIEAVLLHDRSVVARDWKSGALLRGELRRTGPVP